MQMFTTQLESAVKASHLEQDRLSILEEACAGQQSGITEKVARLIMAVAAEKR